MWQRITQLADITLKDKPFTRRAFTDIYVQGRELLKTFFEEAGLTLSLSPAANLIGIREGENSDLPAIALGSHSDTVLEGGRFDGIAGVIAGLEVAHVLQDKKLQHPLVIIDFLSEEPSDYGLSCIGSRGHGGRLIAEQLKLQNKQGETLAEAMKRMGADLESAMTWQAPVYKAFVELHIEQAKRLERAKTDIGIVTGFSGIWRYRVTLEGQADHAGATPMEERQDAFVAAAQLAQVIRDTALYDKSDLVATVGQLELRPGAVNAVPGWVSFSLEIRCLAADKKALVLDAVKQKAQDLQAAGAIQGFNIELKSDVLPMPCDGDLQALFSRVCDANGYSHMPLSSGAGHDAYHMGFVCPSAMVFIPCKDGRSHTPEEYTSPEQIAKGAEVLLAAVLELDKLD